MNKNEAHNMNSKKQGQSQHQNHHDHHKMMIEDFMGSQYLLFALATFIYFYGG